MFHGPVLVSCFLEREYVGSMADMDITQEQWAEPIQTTASYSHHFLQHAGLSLNLIKLLNRPISIYKNSWLGKRNKER